MQNSLNRFEFGWGQCSYLESLVNNLKNEFQTELAGYKSHKSSVRGSLAPKAEKLYHFLINNKNHQVSIKQINNLLWKEKEKINTQQIYVYIHDIKKYIQENEIINQRLEKYNKGYYTLSED